MTKAYVKTKNKGALRVAKLLGFPIEEMPKGAAPFSIVITETKKGIKDGRSTKTRRNTRLGKDQQD